MLYKSRSKSKELRTLEFLSKRMNLSEKDKQHYLNLSKGYEGEVAFDSLTEKLQCDCLILNDLLLKVSNTTFQIDSLIIVSGKIYFFDVKNHEGDYYYDSDKFFKIPQFEIVNPLYQLSRSETLLRQLLLNLKFNLPIEASIVFINTSFTLYQSPLNKPIIYPTQINRYLNKLNTIPSKLNEKHKILAEKLVSLHMDESPFTQLPSYHYDQLRKGITCFHCHSFSILVKGRKCICRDCGFAETVDVAVMRSIREFIFLFPDQKITTNIIHEWCHVIDSKQKIRNVLDKNFTMVGENRWAFYI
ncbi:nuclease-related domain-containing protein [Oceanobacillus bengalensis]|uniref:NERD domain-containing protein n=1 Tax=Oceanobacillus bengalensis TaxID=1435466 RepID=A0A494YRS3_9BACI|nr:nuclease-related domain-containing protein [Oceanobacillus bengalensis]RKQ12283.1 NERD domain-containing protein [Oceanobacillus bengalensis]